MKRKYKTLVEKWAPVLDSDIGSPITDNKTASVLANLLESQVKLNKGFSHEPVNVYDPYIEMFTRVSSEYQMDL